MNNSAECESIRLSVSSPFEPGITITRKHELESWLQSMMIFICYNERNVSGLVAAQVGCHGVLWP